MLSELEKALLKTRKEESMNKRLKYEKYNNLDNIITIDLHNGYTVVAIIAQKNTSNNYEIELHLKENTIDRWELIEEAEHLAFNTNEKTIYTAILKTVSTYLQEGFFDHYIDRYEYELMCFDAGNKLYEEGKRNV